MTSNEVAGLLKESGATVSLDTSSLWSNKKLSELAKLVARVNDKIAPGSSPPISLVVSAPAHGERLFQLRHLVRNSGRTFDSGVIREGLTNKGITIQSFVEEDAESQAELLDSQFKTRESWKDAKRDRALRQLGLFGKVTPSENARCSATTDWLIAAQAMGRGWLLVTEDKGDEFKGVEKRTNLKTFRDALTKLLS